MPQKISSVIREEIMKKYLYGMNQDEIARATGTSEATVSNIIRELKTRIGQKDVEVIVTLTRALSAENISHSQIIPSVRIYNIIEQLGLDVEDESIASFLSEVYEESQNNGIEPKILVETTMRMFKLKPQNVTLENAPKYYEDLMLKIKSKEEKLEELNKEIVQKEDQKIKAEAELQIKLEQTKTTNNTLEAYHMNKKALDEMGVSINDMEKLSNMLGKAASSGFDVSKIIEYTSKKDTQIQLEENIKQSSKKEDSLKINIENLEITKKSIESQIEDLKKITGALQNSINIIHNMKKKGVNPTQIIQWDGILKLSNTELQKFEDELQRFGSMANYITHKKSELQALKNEITSLKSKVKTLTDEKIRLESNIDEIQKITVKHLESISKESINSISNVTMSSKERIRSLSNETGVELEKMSHTTRQELESLMSSLSNYISQVTVVSEKIGRMEILHSITNIINESEWDPLEVYPDIISVLGKFKKRLESQKADISIIRTIDTLIGYMKMEVGRFVTA
ncbi:MAG: hypothetical protein KGI19_07145 [Thaumarchaeota archaeon]|nr:hypothetical protein [Nitrososphaerota archaeon]